MKVLVLCYEYPPVGGGGGRVAAQVAAKLSERGHQIRVLTARVENLPRREFSNGVEVRRILSFRRKKDTCTVPEMGLYVLTGLFPAWNLARRWRPDVIHAHFAVPTGVIACPVAMATGVPFVLTAHLGDVPGGVPEQTAALFRVINPVARFIWRRAAQTTAVSSHVAALANSAYGVKSRIILNGVERAMPPRMEVKECVRILFASRMSVQKNPVLALRALAMARDLPWKLTMAGDGPLLAQTRQEAERMGLGERIAFRGWLAAEDVRQCMEESDLLLMTSLHEGLPMIAVEALQHGMAIVASDIGGLHDVVDHNENGILCQLTPDSFAAALRRLLSDTALLLEMRKRSRRKSSEFDLNRSVDAYENVLLEAASLRA